MVRCPTCGIRLRDDGPLCSTHGAPPAAAIVSDPEAPFEVSPPVLPGYVVRSLLGLGGFGAAFRAERISDGVSVAIKVARADQISASDRLLLEADALRAIGPPFVPAVHHVGRLVDGAAYMIMEFVRAPTLAVHLTAAAGPLRPEQFVQQAPALVDLVAVSHDRGFAHCDLKPENVFVSSDPQRDGFVAKLFDFGLVRRLGPRRADDTREEAPEGTPEYMSPEQCEGVSEVDARSDVYALGVMLYEMAVGAPPFWGNAAVVQQSHRSRRPPLPSRRVPKVPISAALEEVILRCLAKDPERRFVNAGALSNSLRAALARSGLPAAAPASVPSPGGSASETPVEPANKAKVASPRERRAVALLFLESTGGVAAVRDALFVVGGQLAHTAGAQTVIAFGHEVGDNPTRAAAVAAQLFIDRGLCRRAYVDLASVSIQARPDGSRRYQSPLFARKEQYPTEADATGVLLSRTAADVLPDLIMTPSAARPGVMVVGKSEDAPELTSARSAAPVLVGRDEILRTLLEAARRATDITRDMGPLPTITTLLGEPGTGKSHLATVLLQHLEAIHPPVKTLAFRAKEALGGAGDQTTRELFRHVLNVPAIGPSDFGRALLAERLGPDLARELWAGVAVTMGWISTDHPDVRSLSAAPGALRSAAARAAGEALRTLSRQSPLAVVLEDAHFADETALDALEYATLQEAACPIWVCVIGRPAFGGGRTAWASRAARQMRLDLPALDAASAAELARRLLAPAENVPASAVTRLCERTQGIPLLLVELVRGLKRDGLIRRSEKTGGWFLATDELDRLPDLPLVQWLAGREIESLPPELAAHARLASMLGSEFDGAELEGVMQILERDGVAPETELDASVGLRRLIESGLLVRHRRDRIGFRHALLRETVYQTVAATERSVVHGAAYQYFAANVSLPEEQRLPQMALHAARSGLRTEAVDLYLSLAHRAEGRHAYLDAESLYRNAIENLSPPTPPPAATPAAASPVVDPSPSVAAAVDVRQIEARRGLGIMRFRLGRHEDALKDLSEAGRLAHAARLREREVAILLDESLVLDWLSDWSRAAALVDEAQTLAKEGHTPLLEARLVYGQARTLHRADKTDQACTYFEKSAAMAEALGADGYETHILSLGLAGWGYSMLRRFEEAESMFARLVELTEARGDMMNLTMGLMNRCILSLLSQKTDRLIADYKRVIVISRESGLPLFECMAQRDLAEVYFALGQVTESEQQVRRAIDVNRQVLGALARGTIITKLLLGRVLVHRGDIAAAREVMTAVDQDQKAARAAGQTDGEFGPSEQIMADAVGLSVEGVVGAPWQDLLTRARQIMLQPQDLVEVMELRALCTLRARDVDQAVGLLDEAIDEAGRSAEITLNRLRGSRQSALQDAAAIGIG